MDNHAGDGTAGIARGTWRKGAVRPRRRPITAALRGLLLHMLAAVAGCDETPIADRPEQAAKPCTGLTEAAMVWIPGGRFTMGADPRYPEEGPPRSVTVKGFWMSCTEVTNAEFTAFVAATGYRTQAERDPPILPGAPPAMRSPGSAVFRVPTPDNPNWWAWVPGANWRHPSGPAQHDQRARARSGCAGHL